MTKIKILLAEDEASLGMIVKESLESRDFQIFLAENGVQALEMYQNEKPDIIRDINELKRGQFVTFQQI